MRIFRQMSWFWQNWLPSLLVAAGFAATFLLWWAGAFAEPGSVPGLLLGAGILASLLAGAAAHYGQSAARCAREAAEQRARAEQATVEGTRAGDHYLSALEQMPALIWRTPTSGLCDYHNQTWLDFTGRTFEEERGTGWCKGVHPDDLELCIERFERAFKAREPVEMEYRLRHHSGEYRLIADHARPIYDFEGEFSGYLGICFDLTRREQMHAALRESEELFRSIFENASVGMARTDRDGRMVLANGAFLEMLGYSIDELKRLTIEDITHPDDWPRNRDLFQQLIRKEIPSFEIQKRYLRKDGSEYWVQNSVSAAFDAEGVPLYVQTIAQDINDIKATEAALRESEAELADAQAIAQMGSWTLDIGRNEVRCSEELYRVYGMEPGANPLPRAEFLERIPPADRGGFDRIVQEALVSGEQLDYVHGIVRPGGETRTIHVRGRVVRDSAGRPLRLLGSAQDITERMQVEQDLRRSGESYRILAENVNEMIFRFSPQGRITYASPATHVILGYQPAEVIGRDGSEFLHPDDLPLVVEAHRDMLAGTPPPAHLSRLLHRDGHAVWTETTTRAVHDPESGEIESIVAVSRDVTESVLAARLSRLLHVVAMAANEANSPREALQSALALVCEHTGWPVGHAYFPDHLNDGPGALDIWNADDPARHARLRELMAPAKPPSGEGLLERVLIRGEAECIPDIAEDPAFRRSEMAEGLGLRSAFAFPVWSGDETIAVLEFFGEQPEEPDSMVIDLLSNVVARLGEVLRRKQAEQALRASEERFRALAESANDGFVTVDGRGQVVYCNESLQRIFGYAYDEVCGQPIHRLFANGQGDSRFDLEEVLDSGDYPAGRRIELTGRRKDGSLLPLEMSLAGWRTDEGSFVTGILRDISDRKHAERALAGKMEELARSNAELGLFTYVASHDLLEPLRTVGGNVQLLARKLSAEQDEETNRQLAFALGGVRRMQALIEDLLAYSRVGTEGRVFVEMDSAEAAQEAIQALSLAIEESGGTVRVGPLPRVVGDRSQLVQLFQNLLSNAIKFHGSEPPQVDIEAERDGAAWVFTVRDQGIGIESQYAEHVFTIFQRLHTREEYPGSGIGLAVCRKIVERHGGRLWVDSEPGQGSAFRFTIPTRGLRLT